MLRLLNSRKSSISFLEIKFVSFFQANFPKMESSIKVEKVDRGLNSYQFLIERSNDVGFFILNIKINHNVCRKFSLLINTLIRITDRNLNNKILELQFPAVMI